MIQTSSLHEIPSSQVLIRDPFWSPRLLTNSRAAIFHQWEQLEQSRCIDNFRLAAGEKQGFREGWFFSDSDAYKWLDAAARIHALLPSDDLKDLMDVFIGLIRRAQMEDGYLYTYNQAHFSTERWGNLMIEHELYCHGHLIEACVSHYEAFHDRSVLEITLRAADLLVKDFLIAPPDKTSGHEEVEIALMRLYQTTKKEQYLELARNFLERRGRTRSFAVSILRQTARSARRGKFVREQRKVYQAGHPEGSPFQLPLDNYAKRPANSKIRWLLNALTGKFFQQHAPIRKQTVPVGHSVRFTYLETAVAMLYRHTGDTTMLQTLEQAWEHMVTRRMYLTGGIGSLPDTEGFGRDYELNPEIAYAETCAALGSLFWDWEMALTTIDARYSDLFEWQLYNAALVGMGLDGKSYLFNNPLLSRGGITRRPWFKVPCCPSNLSRTLASLGKYIYSFDEQNLWVHQYIGNRTKINPLGITTSLDSCLPWQGLVRFFLDLPAPADLSIHFRIPSWSPLATIRVNGEPFTAAPTIPIEPYPSSQPSPASGYDPRQARFTTVHRTWCPGDVVELDLQISISIRRASPRLRGHQGRVALTRGPLVYCLESVDNPGLDIFSAVIKPDSVHAEYSPEMLGGIWVLRGKTTGGIGFTAIPYQLWANRGGSTMTVWMKA
jgi:uncharacterized protein